MGWLPGSRVHTFGADGRGAATITLAALNHPEAGGALLVRVPFDPGDPFHYYTVEFRKNDGWDAGLPNSTVLIHEVKAGADGRYYTYLLRARTGSRDPLQSLAVGGISISLGALSPATNQATVTIRSDMVERCLAGYVWREAGPNDRVCVTPQTREAVRQDNAQAAARRQPGGAYGPDTCRSGFVWRDAFVNDHICVTTQTRTQAAADNREAANRRNPTRFVYGPNTCRSGFVWRGIDDRDFVCVTSQTREAVRQDNAQAAARRQPGGGAYGPDTCRSGFVWRDAFPGDRVCVTTQARAQAVADNREAENRLMRR